MEKTLVIYCDGGSRGNPGPAASAFVVTQNGHVIHSEGKYLGVETNNIAEYTAVLLAINWISSLTTVHGSPITINLDSQLIQRQLIGQYKVKNTNLKKIFDEIKLVMIKSNLNINFAWGYRDKNKLADELVNTTLDLHTSSTGKE